MPVKIRLMRIGSKKRPFYRVVAVDERSKRTGGYLELLGTYNPLTTPHEISLKQERIDDWMKKGAQPSDGFLRITGKAPQRPPRKPKKEKKETQPKEEPAADLESSKKEENPQETPENSQATEQTREDTKAEADLEKPEETASEEEIKPEASAKDEQSPQDEQISDSSDTPQKEE